jgi:hypothetical protein
MILEIFADVEAEDDRTVSQAVSIMLPAGEFARMAPTARGREQKQ